MMKVIELPLDPHQETLTDSLYPERIFTFGNIANF